LWFIPTITLYLSAIFKPFLYNVSPMEAKKIIDDLPSETVKKMIFKKGLVNILPEKISNTLKNNLEQPSVKNLKLSDAVSNSGSTRSEEASRFYK